MNTLLPQMTLLTVLSPCCQSKHECFRPRKRSDFLRVLLGIFVEAYTIALISILKLLSLHHIGEFYSLS